MLLLIALAALAVVLVVLARTLVADGYGVRPPPRSHREEEEFDAWGLPITFLGNCVDGDVPATDPWVGRTAARRPPAHAAPSSS